MEADESWPSNLNCASNQQQKVLRSRPRSYAVSASIWLTLVLVGASARAQANFSMTDHSSRELRADAIKSIPLDRLSDEARTKILAVVEHPTIFRRLPAKTIECDPDLYRFLIRNPEVIVSMWQLMGITNVHCRRVAPFTHEGSDGSGTTVRMSLLFGSKDTHVFFADGQHEGAVFKRHLNGKCVLVLKTAYQGLGDHHTQVHSRMDFFLQLDNVGAELIAKTVNPLVGKTADNNFGESLNFIGQMSRAAAQKGDGVNLLAKKLTDVEPSVREEFVNVTMNVYQRAVLSRMKARETGDSTALAPVRFPENFPAADSADDSSASVSTQSSNLRLRR